MADPSILEADAINFARQAVEYDSKENYDVAVFYYIEAVQALLNAALCGSKHNNLVAKANEYITRSEELKEIIAKQSKTTNEHMNATTAETERAQYMLMEAFELDEADQTEEAIEAYGQAIELLISIKKSTQDVNIQKKVEKLALQALDRAEVLKKSMQPAAPRAAPSAPPATSTLRPALSQYTLSGEDRVPRVPSMQRSKGSGYTREEITVLRATSNINGREYVPFLDMDSRERFGFPMPFTDKDGPKKLSRSQENRLSKWVRPEEFMTQPQMIMIVSHMSIRQTLVQDCSFVSSMAVSAQYERRFNKKLVTNIIYPQNRNGEAVYNPCGKYMVKLNINGVPRKVIIDDYLPMGKNGELLCSYSQNKNELWVSLLEKAYMKVMGGYDFPGSNSNIDLHALTGWIPERIAIRLGTVQFNKEKEFQKLHKRFHDGHCLITLATGELSDADAERTGLAATHAYALLDIRETQGHQLFMLKNPWSHMRWKGKFSENDTQNWTPKLIKELNYDVANAKMYDNGVFWMDYDSLCRFYDVIYVNWNPDLFPKTYAIHSSWLARDGPKKDVYNISDNPQFRLEVSASSPSPVWVLLTRHITDKDDFANNREFIALVVYKDVPTRRVYYPHNPPPFKDGARINSPHNLVKMVQEPGSEVYNLVVSQYEKNNTIHYTLRVYSTCEFKLTKVIEPYKYHKQVSGQWKGVTAGGCRNNRDSFQNNPTYQLSLDNSEVDNELLIELRAPREYFVGFEVLTVTENNSTASGKFDKNRSGDYKQGYVVMELSKISGGLFNLIPSTYKAGEEGPFIIDISSYRPITVGQLR